MLGFQALVGYFSFSFSLKKNKEKKNENTYVVMATKVHSRFSTEVTAAPAASLL